MSELAKRVYEYLRQHPGADRYAMAAALNVTPSEISAARRELLAAAGAARLS